MIPPGVRSKTSRDRVQYGSLRNRVGPERIDVHRHRLGNPDRVRHLNFAAARELGAATMFLATQRAA